MVIHCEYNLADRPTNTGASFMNARMFLITGLLSLSMTTQAEDLTHIYQLARQNDPTFAAAEAQYQASSEASPRAWASVKPQLNFGAQHSEIEEDRTFSGSTTNESYATDSYQLTLTQTLFNKSQFDAIDQADALVKQAEAIFGNAKDDLIIRVAQRYFNVLSESAGLVFARAEKKAIAQQLDQAKQRFKVGLTAITDVHEAQARYDQAVSSEIEAQRLYDVSLENLREITGQDHKDLAAMKDSLEMVAPTPADIDQWVQTALSNNKLLHAAESGMLAADEGKQLASAGHYPTLNLEADYSNYESNGGQFGASEKDGTSVSLVLNVPIYAGGGISAASREAAANYERSRQLYEQQRRATVRLARNSYLTVISSISQVKALKQSLRSTKTALEATQAGFEVGTRTAVDVLDSQREMYRAQRDYIRARHNYIISTLLLKQAAGTLVEDDIKKINGWLDS